MSDRKQYWKDYYLKNKKRISKRKAIYYQSNIQTIRDKQQNFHTENPWYSHYNNAKSRCLCKTNKNYSGYGERGIKFLLTIEECKELWFRDRAYSMTIPSIDKIDNNGNYEYDNCRFIELSKNATKGNYERRWRTKHGSTN
jgi:hypothetical protein